MSRELLLFCWVQGDDPSHVFPLDIADDKTVGHLKEEIKKKHHIFRDVDAHALKIWKLNGTVPLEPEEELSRRVQSLSSDKLQRLGASKRLRDVFPLTPSEDDVHILVQPPSATISPSSSSDSALTGEPSTKRPRLGEETNDQEPFNGTLSSMRGPSFPALRKTLGPYLVDKTALIEKIVTTGTYQRTDLVLRPRRCGKSCMLHMLRAFFSFREPNQKTLFKGLHIASKRDICNEHMGKYAVIFLDLMTLRARSWDGMLLLFQEELSILYADWDEYLRGSLSQREFDSYQSIIRKEASPDICKLALMRLSTLLSRRSGRGVVVLIDEYEMPVSCASEYGYFNEANEYFGRGVFSGLLKGNVSLAIGILAGITPSAKSGWYSGLNNIVMHPLHRPNSIYAGMVMFTEEEVRKLVELSESTLELRDLKAHYNSYLAAAEISVYNPVSIMSALEQNRILNHWVLTGEHPLIRRHVYSLDPETLEYFTALLAQQEIALALKQDVHFNISDLDGRGIITLLYYAGYLTMTASGTLKIPNGEVLDGWSEWITADNVQFENIFFGCVNGPVNAFAEQWPSFMQATLDPKHVAKERGAESKKTPERLYQVYLLGILNGLRTHGWEVESERRAGSGFIDIRVVSKRRRAAALIELKSSDDSRSLDRDADRALQQIVKQNYRNHHLLEGVDCIREYGMANFHLQSVVKGRYLARSGLDWLEKVDPALAT